tara:strand:+ start:927 stop:2498 length:1572 start_codon:yes stop_codon:yes gene_type:complete
MQIKKVVFKNFYSYRYGKVDFSKYKGIVRIEGVNKDSGGSNGSGKSVFFEAVVYGLFGKSIRKSTEDAMINSVAGKKCCVEIEVDNMLIHRCRKPSSLHVWVDGEEVTSSHANKTQGVIEEHLGIDYKTFMAATVFGQHSSTDFLESSADDKRKIINAFLNLDYVFDMKSKIKAKRSEVRREIRDSDILMGQLEKDSKALATKIQGHRLPSNAESILSEYTLEEVLSKESYNNNLTYRLESLKRDLRSVEGTQIDKARRVIDRGVGAKNSYKCSECGTEQSDVVSENIYHFCKNKVDTHDRKVEELHQQIRKLQGTFEKVPCTPKEYSNWLQAKQSEGLFELVQEMEDKIKGLSKNKNILENRYEIFGFWDRAFSEKGLVKFVIRTIRQYLNDRCNYYLGYLTNGRITVKFDDELVENIEVLGGPRHYISLSGGERRKLNLAVMLGLQSLLSKSSSSKTNLLFFDEVAENLDEDGVNGLRALLYDLKEDKTLFVITHNPTLRGLLDSTKIINVVKTKGESKIL